MTRHDVCDHCAIDAVVAAADAKAGAFADPYVRRAAGHLVKVWLRRVEQQQEQTLGLTVGCPMCGAHADQWCATRTGNMYDDTHGPAYFHAARRRALTELDTPTADVVQLHQQEDA